MTKLVQEFQLRQETDDFRIGDEVESGGTGGMPKPADDANRSEPNVPRRLLRQIASL